MLACFSCNNMPPTPRDMFNPPPSLILHIFFSSLKALHSTVAQIINTPNVLFRFIQFMKTQASLNILQFCLTLGW